MLLSTWKADLCSKKPKPELIMLLIAYFGIPLSCPFTSDRLTCFKDEKIVTFTGSTKKLLSLFGTSPSGVVLKFNIVHDTGKSCFEASGKVVKKI